MYGIASSRVGGIITHVINYTKSEFDEMVDYGFCFNQHSYLDNWLSFIHLTKETHNSFIKRFNITLVETKKELYFLKKLID